MLIDDSSIIDLPINNMTYVTNASEYYRRFIRGNLLTSADKLSSIVSISNFEVYEKAIIDTQKNNTVLNLNFSNIEDYKNIKSLSSLADYDLKDDEIVIDKSILGLEFNGTSFLNLKFASGDIYSNIVNTKVYVPIPSQSYFALSNYKAYTIKGVVDTSFYTCYANKKTTENFRLSMINKSPSIYDSTCFNDYNFYTYNENDNRYSLKCTLENDFDLSKVSLLFEPPVSFVYLSKSAKDDFINYKKNTYEIDNQSISITFINSNLAILDDYEIESDDKVMAFIDYTYNSNQVSSASIFMNDYLQSKFFSNFKTYGDENLNIVKGNNTLDNKEYSLSLPLSLYNTLISFYSSYYQDKFIEDPFFNLEFSLDSNSEKILKVSSIYDDTNLEDSPIYIGKKSYIKLLLEIYDFDFIVSGIDDASNYSSTLSASQIAYSSYSCFLISKDVLKTKSYLQEKNFIDSNNTYKLTPILLIDAFNDSCKLDLLASLSSMLIVISILVLVLIFLLIMDNIGRINKEKYHFGVLRALGMEKKEIVKRYFINTNLSFFFTCLVPSLFLFILFSVFNIYFLSYYYLIYMFLLYVVYILSNLIPLIISLKEKPIEILRKLN